MTTDHPVIMPAEPSEDQLDDMRHALGWPKCYRNYFAAEPTTQAPSWDGLVAMGLATRGRTINQPPHELYIYHVTDAGRRTLEERDG